MMSGMILSDTEIFSLILIPEYTVEKKVGYLVLNTPPFFMQYIGIRLIEKILLSLKIKSEIILISKWCIGKKVGYLVLSTNRIMKY